MNSFDFDAKIQRLVDSFSRLSGQGVIYVSREEGGPVRMNGSVCAFCAACLRYPVTAPFCRMSCQGAAMQALASGEPHFQRCWAGLLQVAVAVAPGGVYQGAAACGGFYTDGGRDDIEAVIRERLGSIPEADTGRWLRRIHTLREISASALRGLGLLLMEISCSEGLNSSRLIQRQHERYERQRRIAEAYATLQERELTPPDVMGDTYQLAAYLRRRDRDGAMVFVSEYLAKLLLVSRWNLTRLRAHVRVLMAVMTSQDILDGMDWTAATGRELMTMARIEKADSVEAICSEVAELVLAHFGRLDAADPRQTPLSERVMIWLQGHFQERATCRDAARAVGASVSAIAHRLQAETGKTYSRLRLDLRLSEAKRLLAESGMSISAIAEHCGFSDQSHFTRLFKAEVNLTPGQFRTLLDVENATTRGMGNTPLN